MSTVSSKPKSLRSNDQQLNELINYMENHIYFARRQITKLGPNGIRTYRKMWLQLTVRLNALGGEKEVCQWQKEWDNLKGSAKKKINDYKKAMNKTGNADPNIVVPNDCDLRISAIFGKHGLGQNISVEVGVVGPKNRTSVTANETQLPIVLQKLKKYPDIVLAPTYPHPAWEEISTKGGKLGPEEWYKAFVDAKAQSEKILNKQLDDKNIVLSPWYLRIIDLIAYAQSRTADSDSFLDESSADNHNNIMPAINSVRPKKTLFSATSSMSKQYSNQQQQKQNLPTNETFDNAVKENIDPLYAIKEEQKKMHEQMMKLIKSEFELLRKDTVDTITENFEELILSCFEYKNSTEEVEE